MPGGFENHAISVLHRRLLPRGRTCFVLTANASVRAMSGMLPIAAESAAPPRVVGVPPKVYGCCDQMSSFGVGTLHDFAVARFLPAVPVRQKIERMNTCGSTSVACPLLPYGPRPA